MKRRSLLLLLVLCPGCLIWNTVEARASAGGVLSRPVVHARLTRHYEMVIVWGESTTHRLDVEVDKQKYTTGLASAATAIRISPDRKTFALHDTETRAWLLYTLGSELQSEGVLSLERVGDPLDELKWPENSVEPVADYSWLQWVAVAGIVSGISFAVWRRRRRKLSRA